MRWSATIKTKFKQAVTGESADTLRGLRRRRVNLAVWKDPLSLQTKAYLEKHDLTKLASGRTWHEGYYVSLGGGYLLRPATNKAARLKNIKGNLLKDFPRGRGKDSLARDILRLGTAFARATRHETITANLLVFRPSIQCAKGGFSWHTDDALRKAFYRAVITMKGDCGTLWRPDRTLPRGVDRRREVWGRVRRKHARQIAPLDLAAFKCRALPNPLVHAVPNKPFTRKRRLVLVLATRGTPRKRSKKPAKRRDKGLNSP